MNTTGRGGLVRRLVPVVLTVLALGGCGVSDALVGVHPAPVESPQGAPLDADAAAAIATRVLDEAAAAIADKGKTAAAARAAAMGGDALVLAGTGKASADAPADPLSTAREPQVLAISAGREWPRAILAARLDSDGARQMLHVLVSASAVEPFKLVASTPMLPGAQLPAAGDFAAGAPLVSAATTLKVPAGSGLTLAPVQAAQAYAAALAVPAPKANPAVSVKDSFATTLATTAAAQNKALAKLATLTQKHVAATKNLVGFRLADGSAVVFTLLTRTDTIKVGAGAKEIVLPAEYKAITGKAKATKAVTLTSLEPVILLVPSAGAVTAIGAEEILVSGKAS